MKNTILLISLSLIFLTQISSSQVDYRKEMLNSKLNLDQDDLEEIEDLAQWLGNYKVGKECYSNDCYESYFYNGHNSFVCPKSENTGVVGFNPREQKFFMSFYGFWGLSSKTPFLITFDNSRKVETDVGFKYKVPMHKGYDLNIEPCNYHRHRDKRFHVCPTNPQYPTLVVYKTYSNPKRDSDELKWCSFTFTRYYGYSKKCHKNMFFNILANIGEDLLF